MFWDNFWPNFFADLSVGLILGLGVALWLSRRETEAEKTKRKKDLLRMVKKELEDNKNHLRQNSEKIRDEGKLFSPCLPGLKDEYWRVLSDGGEIKWISDDFELLEKMSVAYHYIGSVKKTELDFNDAVLDLREYSSLATSSNERRKRTLRLWLLDGYGNVEKYAKEVIENIDPLIG